MKKYFNFTVLLAVFMTLCAGFSSCSDDDDDDNNNYKGEGYIEVSINGKTYEVNYIETGAGRLGNMTDKFIGGFETPDADIDFTLYHYANEKDFKNAKTGDFGINQFYSFGTEKNFDLMVYVHIDGDGDGWYNYVSGGKHTVSNIKLLSTDSQSGVLTYLVEGTFSCSFQHNTRGKTLEMSGKYWTKLPIDPETKL
jgi:hypothetical protein